MSDPNAELRDFIYLDSDRVRSIAAQLGIELPNLIDRPAREKLFNNVESALESRSKPLHLDARFDYTNWTPETFTDGQFIRASGVVRLLDYAWLSQAMSGLPAVLKKMSKLEMEALRNSEEGKRMSKSQLQQRSQENQLAIARVEEMKADELGDVVRNLYGDIVRIKIRPSPENPNAVLVGSAYAECFHDTPAALSQKFGVEVDAGWTVLGQLNIPHAAPNQLPIPTGNRMEDSFEQIALLMNNAFKLSGAPQFPAISFTPIAMYRTTG